MKAELHGQVYEQKIVYDCMQAQLNALTKAPDVARVQTQFAALC